jgi:putative phosphoribosyl transferase
MNLLFNPPVRIPVDDVMLESMLAVPAHARSIAVFSQASGSSRHSPRNEYIARVFNNAGIATLVVDLLTELEDESYAAKFDIPLLSRRLLTIMRWIRGEQETSNLHVGIFAEGTGAAAAIKASAAGDDIGAIVIRSGRPDLAEAELSLLTSPVLLIVGGRDDFALSLNRNAYDRILAPRHLHIVARANEMFEQPGAIEEVANVAASWFLEYLDIGSPNHLLAA